MSSCGVQGSWERNREGAQEKAPWDDGGSEGGDVEAHEEILGWQAQEEQVADIAESLLVELALSRIEGRPYFTNA